MTAVSYMSVNTATIPSATETGLESEGLSYECSLQEKLKELGVVKGG